jgi:DNA (cytosine-5)-methyltransferase 1
MRAFYNEIDTYCCDWLSNLMDAGHITPGVICDKSIEDVFPDELRGFDRCHFFAGIGVWDYALNLAGWGERPVWTGSAPCQPFSQAGKGAGFSDERHLWPAWDWLISECRPAVIVGEQVASKDIDPWIDLVQADLEAMGYAIGCVPFPSAGVGAPHIRDRAYFMAHADGQRLHGKRVRVQPGKSRQASSETGRSGAVGIVADSDGRHTGSEGLQRGRQHGQQSAHGGARCGVADAGSERWLGRQGIQAGRIDDRAHAGRLESDDGSVGVDEARISRIEPAGPTNGFWRDADWLLCRDEKWRPVEPGSFPLADGAPARVGRLRAYGNAINAQAAAEFIRAAREAIEL